VSRKTDPYGVTHRSGRSKCDRNKSGTDGRK
jgi:hypothetical protein